MSTYESIRWDAQQDRQAEYEEERHNAISEWCRCNCPDEDHVAEWVGDGWNEPRGIERYCDGPCGGSCTDSTARRRCGDCGAWCDAEDVNNETCPACGEGRMFRKFLKVADNCPNCHEELYHHRADDFPAYLVIVIVGHILVPIVLAVETEIAPPVWISMALWPLVALGMTLGLLQPVKGAIVAIQWFIGMHGFLELLLALGRDVLGPP